VYVDCGPGPTTGPEPLAAAAVAVALADALADAAALLIALLRDAHPVMSRASDTPSPIQTPLAAALPLT
jgi:hypothetical protein